MYRRRYPEYVIVRLVMICIRDANGIAGNKVFLDCQIAPLLRCFVWLLPTVIRQIYLINYLALNAFRSGRKFGMNPIVKVSVALDALIPQETRLILIIGGYHQDVLHIYPFIVQSWKNIREKVMIYDRAKVYNVKGGRILSVDVGLLQNFRR